MKIVWLSILLVATSLLGHAQAPASPQTNAQPAAHDDDDDKKPAARKKNKDDDDADDKDNDKAKASGFAPNAAVITVKGLCSKPNSKAGVACQTVITRAQFEKLVDAVAPGMSPQTRRQLATSYPKLLIMAHDAEAKGLDHGPRFDELVRFARLQILAQELVRQIKEQAAKVSDKDVADYYNGHPSVFEIAVVDRLFVPIRKEGPSSSTPQANGVDSSLTELAGQLHARATAGEDFAKLQDEAYAAAGTKVSSAGYAPQRLKRADVPTSHALIFDLKPGEVSSVITDASGHYVYKLEEKEVQPLAVAKAGIVSTLMSQRLHDAMENIDHSFSVDVNEPYFAAGSAKADDDD